jgi:hypothetical protein
MASHEIVLWEGVTIRNWHLLATSGAKRNTFCVVGEALPAKKGIRTNDVSEVFRRDDGSTFVRTRSGSVYRLGRAWPEMYAVLTPAQRVSPDAAWWILRRLLGAKGTLRLAPAKR